MKILIVEDELPTRRFLADMIKEIRPNWEISALLGSVEETVNWLKSNYQPDLIFLDIQLSDGTSFEIFDNVEVTSPVIFTTAYDEYALQAFRVNSINYLLKPINQTKLNEAIEKYESLCNAKSPEIDYQELARALRSESKQYRTRIIANLADGFQKINTDDIAMFLSANKVTTAFSFDQQNHIVDFTLDKLEKELNPEKFFRANRQFILNIDAIKKVENWFNGKLVVKTRPEHGEKIVVSRERARSFKEWISQ